MDSIAIVSVCIVEISSAWIRNFAFTYKTVPENEDTVSAWSRFLLDNTIFEHMLGRGTASQILN